MSSTFSRQRRVAEAQRATAAAELEQCRSRADYVNSLAQRGMEELRRLHIVKTSHPA